MDEHSIKVSLRILEFPEDPSLLTTFLGVEPTNTWKDGDVINPRMLLRRKSNGWELSPLGLREVTDPLESFNDHMSRIQELIEPVIEQFEIISQRSYIELSCTIRLSYDSESSIPAIGFEKEHLKLLTRIGAVVDFDIYILPRENSETGEAVK